MFFFCQLCLPSPVRKIANMCSHRLTVSLRPRRGNILRSAASLFAAIGNKILLIMNFINYISMKNYLLCGLYNSFIRAVNASTVRARS